MIQRLAKILGDKKTTYLLIGINISIGICIFLISSRMYFPDAKGYWLMGTGLLNGKFSSWYNLSKYYPETLRTPGYPIFLAFCQLFSSSQLLPKILQLCLYFICIFLCVDIIKRINKDQKSINLFLLFLIPNIQIVFYTGYISAEILGVLFLILSVHTLFKEKNTRNAILFALYSYLLTMNRTAFLLLPILVFLFLLVKNKSNIKFAGISFTTYILLLIPFGIWNLNNHGKFKITSIEGGAGVAHMGFWQLKLPDGYTEKFYWNNSTSHDLLKPRFYTSDGEAKNVIKYESEWNKILESSKYLISHQDSIYLDSMSSLNSGIFVINNSKFTLKREEELWKATINNIKNEPLYYIKSRVYHFFRFYVTGINKKNIANSNGILQKTKNIYPFIVTFIFIFGGLILGLIFTLLKKEIFKNQILILLIILYAGLIHLPFTIQARYTIPVHLLVLIIIASIFASGTLTNSIKRKHE